MTRAVPVLCTLFAAAALAQEKPAIVYKAPPAGEDDRPVVTEIVFGPQGSDYAFKIEFNKEPWGDGCSTRCANATIFLDTDNTRTTGLKLKDPKAPATGADLAVTIQGVREFKEGAAHPMLKVKVKQYSEESTNIEQGNVLVELDQKRDSERVLGQGTSVYLLVDANIGTLPSGVKVRLVYQPADSKPLVGFAKGLSAPGANRIELFKDGKLSNPVQKKKSAYEKF